MSWPGPQQQSKTPLPGLHLPPNPASSKEYQHSSEDNVNASKISHSFGLEQDTYPEEIVHGDWLLYPQGEG